MKRDKLAQLEHFIKKKLPGKLRNDLKKLRITKEADAECCIYYHLRRTIPASGDWSVLARKFARHTGHYIDLIVLKNKKPRLAIELKWNQTSMSRKDRRSLNRALRDMHVNRVYFISVGPNIFGNKYKKKKKTKFEKNRLFEVPVGLGTKPTKIWKADRHLLGREMSIGKGKMKQFSAD